MSGIIACGVCCMLTSAWAILQLLLMGALYHKEAVVLLEDCDPHEYDDYDDYISKTKANYQAVALNCWIAMGIYILTFAICYICVARARNKERQAALKFENDEFACAPKELTLKELKEQKKKDLKTKEHKIKELKKEKRLSKV